MADPKSNVQVDPNITLNIDPQVTIPIKSKIDPQTELILNYFKNQSSTPPGERTKYVPMQTNNPTNSFVITQSIDKFDKFYKYNQFQAMEHKRNGRNKRVIDSARTSRKYYDAKLIFTPTLNHYENMEWWERDSTNDFYKHI